MSSPLSTNLLPGFKSLIFSLTSPSSLLPKSLVSLSLSQLKCTTQCSFDPVIKGVSTLGHFAVDISINQRGGLKAAPIVDAFMQQLGSHAARALIMVVKAFLMQRGLHEVYSGGLGSYSVICLVISFLQLHPRIQDGHIDPNQNLGVLLLEFFELYGCNFKCVFISDRIPKENIQLTRTSEQLRCCGHIPQRPRLLL